MQYTLMHVSDLHAGRPFNARLAVQLVEEAHALRPDLLVVSGDFVQRADFQRQWRTIQTLLRALPEPLMLVPGNHDVPLFHVFQRLFRPLDIYKREISPEINPVFARPGLLVVGGNSAHGLTIEGGYVNADQRRIMTRLFAQSPAGTCKVAVLHHHLISPPGHHSRKPIRNTKQVLDMLEEAGVNLLLCGHLHRSYVGTTLDLRASMQPGTIICQSGTTTSHRGKGAERGKNSYNVIRISDAQIRIQQHTYLAEHGRYELMAEHAFPRK